MSRMPDINDDPQDFHSLTRPPILIQRIEENGQFSYWKAAVERKLRNDFKCQTRKRIRQDIFEKSGSLLLHIYLIN